MKKLLVLFLAISLVIVLSACGKKEVAAPAGSPSPAPSASAAPKASASPAPSASASPAPATSAAPAPATSAAPAPAAPAAAVKELKISGSSKTFQFDQPEYKVKKGEPVNVTLVNLDGVHGVEIKGQGITKLEAGKSQTFTPTTAGTYDINCVIPCGSGHMTMKSKLIVE